MNTNFYEKEHESQKMHEAKWTYPSTHLNEKWRPTKANKKEIKYKQRMRQQKYRCAICKIKWNKGDVAFHSDHNHKTNKERALLCHFCNCMLGFAKDKIKNLRRGIKYLRKWRKLG